MKNVLGNLPDLPRFPTSRRLWLVILGVGITATSLVTVFPTKSYLAQRDQLNRTQRRIDVLQEQNARVSKRVEDLQKDSEIERIAREQYNLVRPGEEAYAILPSATSDAEASDKAKKKVGEKKGFWSRLWDRVTPG